MRPRRAPEGSVAAFSHVLSNGFRCQWGAETDAPFRPVVSTAKANRASVLDTVRFVISAKRAGDTLAGAA
jgi:hypothetical protein